jgi:8-oxo-dGTP pyrophosphatase MutT (NUDIX family)
MRKLAHQTIGVQKQALVGEVFRDFDEGDRVMTRDGYPGRVTYVLDGPYPQTETYEVSLDNGAGGGSYSASQLSKMADTTAARDETLPAPDLGPIEATTYHQASDDYPELGDILHERPPNERVRVFASKPRPTKAFPHGRRNGVEITDPEYSGESGIVRCDNCGKYHAATYDHEGQYGEGRIHAVVCPEDHLTDYYTDERLEPRQASTHTRQLGDEDLEREENPQAHAEQDREDKVERAQEKAIPAIEPIDPPDACSFCGSDQFEDPTNTGRGTRMRCAQCGGTMTSWGGQWQPEMPNSPENAASRQGDYRSTINDLSAVHAAISPEDMIRNAETMYGTNREHWSDAALRKATEHGDEASRGELEQRKSGSYTPEQFGANVMERMRLWDEGTPESRQAAVDPDFSFHMVATWADVRRKAKRIKDDGGVRIVAASHEGIVGEVQGDHHLYESSFTYVPGRKAIAAWDCGCKWGAYAWGRSPAYARFEGRQCSHVTALQFEAASRGMFGATVQPDEERLTEQYQRSPVTVEYQRPTTRDEGGNRNRRSVPPGNMRTQWTPNSRVRVKGSLDDVHPESEYAHLGHDEGTAMDEAIQRVVDRHRAQMSQHWREHGEEPAGHDELASRLSLVPEHIEENHYEARGRYPTPQEHAEWADALLDDHPWKDEVHTELHKLKHEPWAHHQGSLDLAPVHAFALQMVAAHDEADSVLRMLTSYGIPTGNALGIITWAADKNKNGIEDSEEATADPMGGQAAPGTDIPRLEDRDQSDAKHKRKHILHHTNDSRQHAPNFGYGIGYGIGPLIWCDQCNGSGCGHCGGTGQVVAPNNNPTGNMGPGDASLTSAPIADQSPDAGDAVSGDGLSATSGLQMHEWLLRRYADYTADSFMTGGPAQTYQQSTPHSNSPNPGSTGWATSSDPPDWEQPIIGHDFGIADHYGAATKPPYDGMDADEMNVDHAAVSTDGRTCDLCGQETHGQRHIGAKKDEGEPGDPPTVSGVALKAADTKRVLMIQRSNKDEKDPARGTWEFPGGHHEEGDQTSLHAGIREWEEETGHPFPEGGHVSHTWRSGPYQGHVVVIPKEEAVDFSNGRATTNPDDPDGDDHEQSAWWEIEHAKKNPALRQELKEANPWSGIAKAATLHDEPEPALPSTDGADQDGDGISNAANDLPPGTMLSAQPQTPWGYRPGDPNLMQPDPSSVETPADAYEGDAAHDSLTDDVTNNLPFRSEGTLNVPVEQLVAAFQATAGGRAIMADAKKGSTGKDGDFSDAQIAAAAQEVLAKTSAKDFSFSEQQELISEGGTKTRARNFDDLQIEGTHYARLGDEIVDDDEFLFL